MEVNIFNNLFISEKKHTKVVLQIRIKKLSKKLYIYFLFAIYFFKLCSNKQSSNKLSKY